MLHPHLAAVIQMEQSAEGVICTAVPAAVKSIPFHLLQLKLYRLAG